VLHLRNSHADLPAPSIGVVGELDSATMLLKNFADDRKAESRSPLAGRHVGLEQSLPPLNRESLAVIRDDNGQRTGVVIGLQ